MARPIDPRVVALHARMFANRLRLPEVLNRAGVPRSTWWRWEIQGAEPRWATLGKIEAAIDAKIAEKESPNGS